MLRSARKGASRSVRPPAKRLNGLFKLVGEGVARATHGAHRVLLGSAHHRLAQAADMNVDGALIDIDVAAPNPVEHARG